MSHAAPNASAAPVVLAPHPDGIPAELRARPQWVTHREKVPYCALADKRSEDGLTSLYGKKIDYTDEDNLAGFDEACRAVRENGHDGVGFSTLPVDPYILIDVDHCVRPDGSIAPLVLFWAQRLGTYAEYSPGDGMHMIGRGRLHGEGNRFSMTDPTTGETFKVEVYGLDRYFRITGHTPEGLPTEITENQDAIDVFYSFLVEQRGGIGHESGQGREVDATAEPSPRMSDEEIMLRARNARNGAKFRSLFDEGNLEAHGGDDSSADMALCCVLAFWTQDGPQVDRLFRASRLMRPKWDDIHFSDRATYGARTIENALALASEHYSPPAPPVTEEEERETRRGDCVYQTIDLATGERQVHRGGIVCRRGGGGELRTTRGAQWLP